MHVSSVTDGRCLQLYLGIVLAAVVVITGIFSYMQVSKPAVTPLVMPCHTSCHALSHRIIHFWLSISLVWRNTLTDSLHQEGKASNIMKSFAKLTPQECRVHTHQPSLASPLSHLSSVVNL